MLSLELERTNVGVDPSLREQRNERREDCRASARALLSDAALRHVEMDIPIGQELLIRRLGDAQLICMALHPRERDVRALPDDLAKLTCQLQTALARHRLEWPSELAFDMKECGTHQSFDRHDSPGTVAQISKTRTDASGRCLRVQTILGINRRTNVVFQVFRRDSDMDGLGHIHRLALHRSDSVVNVITVGRCVRSRGLGCCRVVDRRVLLLNRRGGLRRLGLGLDGSIVGRSGGLGTGSGNRLREDVFAKVLDDLQSSLAIDLRRTTRQSRVPRKTHSYIPCQCASSGYEHRFRGNST